MEQMIHRAWRIRLGILGRFLQYLMMRKFTSKHGAYCFRMQREWIWRYPCRQIWVYGRDFGFLFAMNLLRKGKAIKGLWDSLGVLDLWGFMFREREYFLYIWLQERCVNICWKSWNKRRRSVWERGVTRKCYDSRDCWEILNTPTPNALMVQRFDLLKGLTSDCTTW